MNGWQQFLLDQAISMVISLLKQLVGSPGGQSQYLKVFAKIFVSIWQVFGGNTVFLQNVKDKGLPIVFDNTVSIIVASVAKDTGFPASVGDYPKPHSFETGAPSGDKL